MFNFPTAGMYGSATLNSPYLRRAHARMRIAAPTLSHRFCRFVLAKGERHVNSIVGAILAYLLLALTLYAQSVVLLARSRALGATVAGMAVRNTLLMLLLSLGAPGFPGRTVQAWKRIVLLLLVVPAARTVRAARREGRVPRANLPEVVALPFAALIHVDLLSFETVFAADEILNFVGRPGGLAVYTATFGGLRGFLPAVCALSTSLLFFPVSDFPSGPAQPQVPTGAPSCALPPL